MAEQLTLGELIAVLETADPTTVLPIGFDTPHSYRGYYEQLAFEPATGVTVGQMLGHARDALGATFEGYKGGLFTMREDTDCWVASWGACGEELTAERLRDMLTAGHRPGEQAAAGPMSDERLAEIQREYEDFPTTDVADLLAEVERLRAELAEVSTDHAEQIRRAWMVSAEMHEFNSPEGDHLEGCPGCRIEAALGGTEAGQ